MFGRYRSAGQTFAPRPAGLTPAPAPMYSAPPQLQSHPAVFVHAVRGVRVLTPPAQGWAWWLTAYAGAPCWVWRTWSRSQKLAFLMRYYYPTSWWSGQPMPALSPGQSAEINAQLASIEAACVGQYSLPQTYSLGGPWGVAL